MKARPMAVNVSRIFVNTGLLEKWGFMMKIEAIFM